ncbi:unnamed protein product [Amaranthus hypochondriacus]
MIIRAPLLHSPLSSLSLLRFTAKPKPPFPHTLSFRLYASSVNDSAETKYETPNTNLHPWPEWVTFIDRLKSHGYFPQSADTQFGYGEITQLKDPCLSFARDRYDLFRSFSKEDIQCLVKGGCPKIQRKIINSAKRLRVYVGLEEKSVCEICSLQGSCDRAYLMLGDSEGGARMVDLMRLLLAYALDPMLSGAESAPSILQAESASRRVLSLLINLTEASTGLAPLKSSEKLDHKKEQSAHHINASVPRDVQMNKRDWNCLKCGFVNFQRNSHCRKCNEQNPKWVSVDVEMKKGDWKCIQCGIVNFASRRNCFRCKDPRPPRELNPGEWECTKCDFLNFRRNVTCLKCGGERHKEAVSQDKIANRLT